MVVNGLNSAGLFTAGAPSFLIADVTGILTLHFDVEINSHTVISFSESYYPDASGKIVISNLHTLAQIYHKLPGLLTIDSSAPFASYGVTIRVKYLANDTLTELFSQKFLYCRQRTSGLDGNWSGFLSRYSSRLIRVGQPVYCGYIAHGQTFEISVAYRTKTQAKYATIATSTNDTTGKLILANLSLDNILTQLNSFTGITYTTSDIIYVDAVLRDTSGTKIDQIRHEVDSRYFPQATTVIFYNLFGIPDTLVLTGKKDEETELNATFITTNGSYRKLESTINDKYSLNTGFLNPTQQDAVKDLITSPDVFIVSDGTVQDRITITEVSAIHTTPTTEPTNFKLTYKLANTAGAEFNRNPSFTRIFDKTFDYTFD